MTLDSIRGIALAATAALALSACSPATVGEVLDAGVEQDGTACCASLAVCCRTVLVNPIFLESCNQVARKGQLGPCADLLEGYIECRPFFNDGGIDPSVCDDTTEEP